MVDKLVFGIGKAVGPSATSFWYCPCPGIVALLCLLLGWGCVFRRRVVVVVNRNRNALPPLLLDVTSQQITINISFDVRHHIAIQNPIRIHRLARHRLGIHTRNWIASLALKGNLRRRLNPEVFLDNVEDGSIVNIFNADKVAHLVLVLDPPDAFACHQHTSETALFFMRPLLFGWGGRIKPWPSQRLQCHQGWLFAA